MKRHKWHDVIQAYIDGKTIQFQDVSKMHNIDWADVVYDPSDAFPDFNYKNGEWRIKPATIPVVFRVALCKNAVNKYYCVVVSEYQFEEFETKRSVEAHGFVEWATPPCMVYIPENAEFYSR